jgi:hypothetical protein
MLTDTSQSGSTVTFSGANFGDPRADRVIIIGVGAIADNIASLVIGGVSGSLASGSRAQTPSPFAYCSGIYSAAIPTGTSGTVVITASGTTSTSIAPSIAVYAAYGLFSATAVDGDAETGNATTKNVSVNVPSGGVVVGYGGIAQIQTTPTILWSGITKDNQTNFGTGREVSSASFGPATSTLSPLAVSVSLSDPLAVAPNVSIASYR